MLIAHKIALDLTNVQATYMARATGTARFAYNYALAEWKRQYEAWKLDSALAKPSQMALRRQLNAIKREQSPWMLEVTKNAPQMAIIQLGEAFKNFFAGQARYPQFRQKGVHDRFSLINDQFAIIRTDALHQLTTSPSRRFHTIGIEDLNIKGMVKNRHLSHSIADMGFFEFRRQLEYKAAMRGGQVVVADRFFASSKTCSACGSQLDVLPLSVRGWTCQGCGTNHDRDINAAINLRNMAVSSTVSACGEEGAGSGRKTRVKSTSVKQEVSSRLSQ